jgi:single-strand DNA-binding protein
MNKVFLFGRVGKEPTIRVTANADQVASFSIATSTISNRNGERKEHTEWHNCTAFKTTAGIVEKYVQKGLQLLVEGSIRTREYEKDGQKRYSTEIIVDKLTMVGKGEAPAIDAPAAKSSKKTDPYEDDVPF